VLCHDQAAFLGKHFHPDRDTCNVYIVFEEKDSALKALAANNTKVSAGTECVRTWPPSSRTH
jgi:hypothetical protein